MHGNVTNAQISSFLKHERKRPFRKLRNRREDNINTNVKENYYEGVD
jgi:hypothetical protein